MSGLPQIEGVTGLTEIGRGGFGVVYRGTETEFGRDVAVKVLMSSLNERTRKRFERERRAMGAVSDHPNIVTVYRGGLTQDNQPYLVMEYLAGGSLSDRLNQVGPLDWRAAAAIGGKLSDALTKAHRAGILHRDVKPGNIFLTESGEPKLGDFGIARLDDGQDSRTGSITASVAHAPPEIVDGQRGDERSDLYSLASTVYALTIGSAPFSRDPDQGLAALLSRIANDDPPPLHLETAADDFEASIFRALSKEPNDRHETVGQLGNELRRAALAPITQPIRREQATPEPAAQPNATSAAAPAAAAAPDVETPPTLAQAHDVAQPIAAEAPTRQTNIGQLAMLGLLALVIAGFGGWAVARAVFGGGDTQIAQSVTPEPIATAAPAEPTAIPTRVPATPTVAPAPAPTRVPTPAPTTEPTPEPTPTSVGGGERGSTLGASVEGFTRVSDFSGTITVEVPEAWATEIHDSRELPLEDVGANTRILTVGGSLQALSGDAEIRDLTVSGIYVFTARLDGPVQSGPLLDGSLEFWSDCSQGERSQILLDDGNADFQILACDRDDGGTSGVVALTLVPNADDHVGVSVFLQFAEMDDLESLQTVLGTLRIDPSKIPTSDSGA